MEEKILRATPSIFLSMNITLRQDTCFADLVAKTKKFNKAQVEFRLAKRVER